MLHLSLISSDHWSSDHWTSVDDPAARIDRVLTDRSHRLSIGVNVDASLKMMQCALVMTGGHGKYLRVSHVVGKQVELPKTLVENWTELRCAQSPPLSGYRQFTADLADVQIQVIEQVKQKAGKYVDRILFASVLEPGLWLTDFDGSKIYCGLTDSNRIAAATGLTVIDDYPINDVLAGGEGGPLAGLPLWLTLSDRSPKVADQHRVVLLLGGQCEGYLLPASDGLDSQLPEINCIKAPGSDFLEELNVEIAGGRFDPTAQSATADQQLLSAWKRCSGDTAELVQIASGLLKDNRLTPPVIMASAMELIVQSCLEQIENGGRAMDYLGPQPARGNVRQIYLWGDRNLQSALLPRLRSAFLGSEIMTETHESIGQGNVLGLVAALLGILHVDQMQANIPAITGASQQRILGRLTPGSPSNWRQLVRDMSDYRPPAMKLRDAV